MEFLVVLILLLGLVFDYTNGFHDSANIVSTIIATKLLRPLVATVVAGVLTMLGATQISGVAETITQGLVTFQQTSGPMIIAALVSAILWNLFTWYFRIPCASTYALIGALIGAGIAHNGFQIVIWRGVLFKVLFPMVFTPLAGFILALLAMRVVSRFAQKKKHEKLFRYLQFGSASIVAFAYGLNDAQKSMAIITLGLFAVGAFSSLHIPLWLILTCAVMMGLGTATGGFRIIKTVGYRLTELKPAQGVVIETSAAAVLICSSLMGFAISSTNMVVGSVVGAGSAKGYRFVNWSLARQVMLTWLLSIPATALLGSGVYHLLKYL